MQHKEFSSFRALKCLYPETLQESPDISYVAEFRQHLEEAEEQNHRDTDNLPPAKPLVQDCQGTCRMQ